MKPITNLNLLDISKAIVDDEDRLYIVLSAYNNGDFTVTLKLVEVNDEFTQYTMTVPVACDKDMNFTSIKDKDFRFKFYEVNITKEELAKAMRKEIRATIDKQLKEKK